KCIEYVTCRQVKYDNFIAIGGEIVDNPLIISISLALILIVGIVVGYLIRKSIAEAKISSAEDLAKQIVDEAHRNADAAKKEALLEAKDGNYQLRQQVEEELRERSAEIEKQENRLTEKEENLDQKSVAQDKRELMLEKREQSLGEKQQQIKEMESKEEAILQEQHYELERISGYTTEQATNNSLERIEKEVSHEASLMIKETQSRAKEEADKKAKQILSLALQRCAADHVAETTVSVVNLPNDEMKGRIIGREGRNIRTLETLTGIDLIIDDTPEAVILSGFDPIRREIARISLEKLVQDGRIHPARIEEMVEKSRREVDEYIREIGEETTFE